VLSAAQLELRRTGIGASEIAAIAGINPWATAWDVYLRKILPENDAEPTDAMELGNLLEDGLAQFYARKHPGVRLTRSTTLSHREHPWALATPDRLVIEDGRLVRLLEVKTAGLHTFREWGREGDEIPEQYIAQVQWQLFVAGSRYARLAQHVDLVALVAGSPRLYRVQRNEALIAFLFDKAQAFMDLLASNRLPSMDGSEAARRYLLEQFPAGDGSLRPPTAEEADLARAYLAAHERETAAAKEKAQLKNRLCAAIGEADGLLGSGIKATWKAPEGARVDWKAIAQALAPTPDLIAKHSTPHERRLSVTAK
jgi:putative phage-type endonuclease